MPLSSKMPDPWWDYGATLREDRLPPANYIDKSGAEPVCRVRPLEERLLEELTRRGRLDVVEGSLRMTLRMRPDPRAASDRYLVAVFQGDLQREPYESLSRELLLDWLYHLRPVLRACKPPRGSMPHVVPRRRIESIVWSHLHPDFRGTLSGRRAVLRLTDRGTELCPLVELTDDELRARVPHAGLTTEEREHVTLYFAAHSRSNP